MGGLALTARDLQALPADDHREKHLKSMDVFHAVLRHRGIEVQPSSLAPYLDRSLGHDESDLDHRRHAHSRRIFAKLRERGVHGTRSFRIMLHHMDMQGKGLVLARTFEGALSQMGIRLLGREFEELMELFGTPEDPEIVDYVRYLACGVENWSFPREEVVSEAFSVLSEMCPGDLLDARTLEREFQHRALAHEDTGALEFFKQMSDSNLKADGIIRWGDFLDYYLDISVNFDSDEAFCNFVCDSWDINTDDWLAKKVFRRFADPENRDMLPFADFIQMLGELDPTTTDAEARAWYAAIDEDGSGEVSLEEFLSSKVLKVKRLFDEFVGDGSRTADKATVIKILQTLNECITDEEAEAVYCYADLDNSGTLEFIEFLTNNLLKLLQIFDDYNRDRRRRMNEVDIKRLFLKLDPLLSDEEVVAIYKAIDVDGSGEISFIEFCQSHILRAKSMFDRYDTTRSRALTQFKFREMLLDMDETLTAKEMEAIYHLVMDQNDEKVHLAGFLNPNIVKLKLLFDKYDEDRSRNLDAAEFSCMLKDIYGTCNDAEIESIVRVLCPSGDEGISFTTYFLRFKEIARKHDLIHMSKRRAAREKAKSRGLLFKALTGTAAMAMGSVSTANLGETAALGAASASAQASVPPPGPLWGASVLPPRPSGDGRTRSCLPGW
eukprot:CAMPEP_0170208076 /NCGR_PEP_ID=MMETSP0116_2-20130129/3619_1 /TAXON_ID=400756 /ORGANISM="Durinskia baltica, Strain CSIRO CS-38" /LENGTH=665 /DNA_ID=CAMNT_0010458541 /DNA_START=15 /DNA_END=2009 /DNA_ORIENTATION=-